MTAHITWQRVLRVKNDFETRIRTFRALISPNLLSKRDFIDWAAIDERLRSEALAISRLQDLVDEGPVTKEALAQLLRNAPSTYPLLLDLIGYSSSGSQVEKWGIPQTVEPNSPRADWVVDQLLHVGLDRLLNQATSIEALVRVAEVHKDVHRRKFRSAGRLEERTNKIVRNAIKEANSLLMESVATNVNAVADPLLRRSLTHVIAIGNRPVAGVSTVFQNQSGGRQQRDLSATYPNLQSRLEALGMVLILIADGQGLREASDRTINALFEGVRYPMTLRMAEDGDLAEAIVEASESESLKPVNQTALNEIISQGLRTRMEVRAEDLPVSRDQARIAIAYFVESRRKASLILEDDGNVVSWEKRNWVERARALRSRFDPQEAASLFAEILLLEKCDPEAANNGYAVEYFAPDSQPFAEKIHIRTDSVPLSLQTAREISQISMQRAPGSPVAVYLTHRSLSASEIHEHRRSQIFLPTNIVVVSPNVLESMAKQKQPIMRFMDTVLTQSDLTKVSPYILNNATPARMFYGREREAATVLQTISTNSVAILGSRRIGKTSLLRLLRDELAEAGYLPFFGDCQTVRTWEDFADLARRAWQVDLPEKFRPNHLADLVFQLSKRGEGQVLIVLDEIDQLLDWDQLHVEDSVPEAFFRACRSLSQEGAAQFVFSGERRIANRLWDPQSPHWNFCRELQIAQLDETDALALLIEPLKAMNIEILDPANFQTLAWERTSGHPQIVQFLGDRLVRALDDRSDRQNLQLSIEDLRAVTETFEFADHYLNTYWGQATAYERDVSRAIANGCSTSAEVSETLSKQDGNSPGQASLLNALRMLQMYGTIEEHNGELRMRAEWFADALAQFSSSSLK